MRHIEQSKRRTLIVMNYIALVLCILCFVWATNTHGNVLAIILAALTFAGLIGTAFYLYYKTGYMFLANARNRQLLDERQSKERMQAVATSYAIYGVYSIIALAFFTWFLNENGRTRIPVLDIDQAIFTLAIYLVNILPASIIAWTERDLPAGEE